MKLTCQIRNNETGEIRDYQTEDSYIQDSDFWWTEGNAACDCNRGLFFGYAAGLEYDQIQAKCGEGKYSIKLIGEDGKVYLDELAPEPKVNEERK